MDQREPMIQTMNASQARREFSQLVNRVFRRETRIVVERSGIPVAAIISAGDLDRLNRLDAERAREFSALDALGEAFKDVPDEEIEREVARAVTSARKRARAKERTTARAS